VELICFVKGVCVGIFCAPCEAHSEEAADTLAPDFLDNHKFESRIIRMRLARDNQFSNHH